MRARPDAVPPPGSAGVSAAEARRVAEAARETTWSRQSFGRDLFLGRLRLPLVDPLPPPAPTPAAAAFLRDLEAFARTELDGPRIEREARIPDEVITGLAALGAFGMKIDPKYGGLGLSFGEYARALMLVGSVSPAVGALLSAHQSIGVPQPLKLFGTPAQRRAYLPRLAAGEISAFLLTEPDVGSDPARLATTATPTPDGAGYLLNGVKLWATNGTVADLLVVIARVPRGAGHPGGITAFVVEADSPGIRVARRNQFMGLRGLENSLTRFTDVAVPAANVIGAEGLGLRIALTTLNTGRLSLPALCVGAGKWALSVARRWSGARVQWGQPVGAHDAVAGKIAFIAASTYGMEAMLDLCCRLADADRTDIRIEAALIKLVSSELAWQIADALMQIRGGRGYETAASLAARGEPPVAVEQLLRDLRINRVFEGSTEIMHLMIAREAVDAHLAVAGDLVDPAAGAGRKLRAGVRAGGFYARWLPTLLVGAGSTPLAYGAYGPLAVHLRWAERASRRLARETFAAMGRWQGGLERRQRFLGRIVDIGAELFGIVAVCVRARERHAADPTEVELADLYCRQARARAGAVFATLWRNTDDADSVAAAAVLAGRYAGLEDGVVHAPDGTWVAAGPDDGDARRRVT